MADILLGGSVSTTGTSILGKAIITITNNTDHTLSVAEYTNNFLQVVSDGNSTSQRNIIAPLVVGQTFIVQNLVSESLSVQIIGPTGTGVVVRSNTIVLVVCDGTNYASTTAITTAELSTIDPTNGQPFINSPANGAHLTIGQDITNKVIDGTYGDGSLAWQTGVWVLLGRSVIRLSGQSNTSPIMRIELPNGFSPQGNNPMQWDQPANNLYIFGNNHVYVVDTTPRVDPSGLYVNGCPGVSSALDLTAQLNGAYAAFLADTRLGHYWFFTSLGGTAAYRVDFTGGNFTTITLANAATDCIFINNEVWIHSYAGATGSNSGEYLERLNPDGTANATVLVNAVGSNLSSGMAYDYRNHILWTGTGGLNGQFAQNVTVVGISVGLTPAIVYSFTPAGGGALTAFNISVDSFGNLVIDGTYVHQPDGTPITTINASAGSIEINRSGNYYTTIIHDALLNQDTFFAVNNADGTIHGQANFITNQSIPIWAFLGGLQEWVLGGGNTYPPIELLMGYTLLVAESSAAAVLKFIPNPVYGTPTIPYRSGKFATITSNTLGFIQVDGLTGIPNYLTQTDIALGTITISNAANPVNNGTFTISFSTIGPTTATFYNFNIAAGPDANNGNLDWVYRPAYTLTLLQNGSFGPKIFDFSAITNITQVSTLFLNAPSGGVDLVPSLNISPFLMVYCDGTNPPIITPIMINGKLQSQGVSVATTRPYTNFTGNVRLIDNGGNNSTDVSVFEPQGTTDPITGQKITNSMAAGTVLSSTNDTPYQVIDGTYNDGTVNWELGFWIISSSSVIRSHALVNQFNGSPLLRIPLPKSITPALQRTAQFDSKTNTLYVFDAIGLIIYVIDVTPTLDPSNSYIISVPGVIKTLNLNGTSFSAPPTPYLFMTIDLDLNQIYLWDQGGDYGVVDLNGNLVTGFSSSGSTVSDGIWTTPTINFGKFFYCWNAGGTLTLSTLGRIAAGTNVASYVGPSYLGYDPVQDYVFVTNDRAIFIYNSSLGYVNSFVASTTITAAPIPLHNGHVVVKVGSTLEEYDANGNFIVTVPATYTQYGPCSNTTTYIPGLLSNVIATADQTTDYLVRSDNSAAIISSPALTFNYLGGLQQWVNLSGATAPSGTGFTHITGGIQDSAAKLVTDSDVDASAAIQGTKISPNFGNQQVVTNLTVKATDYLYWPRRETPDVDDVIVWTFFESVPPFANTGTGSVQNLLQSGIAGNLTTSGVFLNTTAYSITSNGLRDTVDTTIYPPVQSFSVSLWVYPNSSQSGSIIALKYDGSGNHTPPYDAVALLSDSSNSLVIRITIAGVLTETNTGVVIPTGQWNHIGVTWDGISFTPYVNGVGYSPVVLGVVGSPVNLDITGNGYWFVGPWDDAVDPSVDMSVADARVADITRTAGYFDAIYNGAVHPDYATSLHPGRVQLTGDFGGTAISPRLINIDGVPLNLTSFVDGNSITYDGTTNKFVLRPGGGGSSGTVGGDLSGSLPNPTVIKIRTVPISATTPTTNQALVFNGTAWAPAAISASQLTPPTGQPSPTSSFQFFIDSNTGQLMIMDTNGTITAVSAGSTVNVSGNTTPL